MAIARAVREEKRSFENAQLRLREAASFDEWWQAVCGAAEDMDFVWVSMNLTNRDGTVRTLVWRRSNVQLPPGELVSMTVPVRHRRPGPPLRVEVAVDANGSLESAGRRVTFFGRLIDEHSVAALPVEPRRGRRAAARPSLVVEKPVVLS